MKLDEREFAAILDKAAEIHEASWGGEGRYKSYLKDWDECCREAGASPEWAEIMAVLVIPGYVDVWNWTERTRA